MADTYSVCFVVEGKPIPQPRHSPRGIVRGILAEGAKYAQRCPACRVPLNVIGSVYIPASGKIRPWKQAVQAAYESAIAGMESCFPLPGPIMVYVEIVTDRSKSSILKTRANPSLWDDRSSRVGDVDNYAKAILDVLNGRAWTDDGQVALLVATKRKRSANEPPHAAVYLTMLAQPFGDSVVEVRRAFVAAGEMAAQQHAIAEETC